MKPAIIFLFLLFLSGNVFSQDIQAIKIADLEKRIADARTPLIINFWASWCKPCIGEIPHFEKIAAEFKNDSVQLLLISLDFADAYPQQLKSFIQKRNYQSEVMWLNETNADTFCPKIDSSWSGTIPATLFINNKTRYSKFLEDKLSEEEFRQQVIKLLSLP